MRLATLPALLIVPLMLAGCSRLGSDTPRPFVTADTTPAVATTNALAATDLAGFVDPRALALFSQKDRTEAASAQFYALQFGRPGAPRMWQGDGNNSGKITVGPYVRVNNLDCRDFSSEVTTGTGVTTLNGTACREADGHWTATAS